MCFTIPKKIEQITDTTAIIEGGQSIDIGAIEMPRIGDYILVTGSIAIAKLERSEGASVRSLIKETHDALS